MIKPQILKPQILEPQLIEYDTLKDLLHSSYNEGSTPFVQIIGKYTKLIVKDNWFYLLVIIFILIIVYLKMNKTKPVEKLTEIVSPKKKDSKYKNVNEYYTNYPRIKNPMI